MKLQKLKLTKEHLKENYKYWLQLWPTRIEPDEEIYLRFTKKVLTTHTFPFQKRIDPADIIPYEAIFSESTENGVLSNGYRKLVNINPDDDKSSRNIPLGLENYVFAYLGIHQPYYARKQNDKLGINAKPFGIFVKSSGEAASVENFDDCHASRRDTAEGNEDVNQAEKNKEFLLAEDARILMAYQVCNDSHHTNFSDEQEQCFWHYYGNIELWRNKDYAMNSWKKKAEFRYFEKIKTSDIKAVLWPIWVENVVDSNPVFSRTYDDLKALSKKFPDIQFVKYDLDLRKPELCFVGASFLALKSYLSEGKFPEKINLSEIK